MRKLRPMWSRNNTILCVCVWLAQRAHFYFIVQFTTHTVFSFSWRMYICSIWYVCVRLLMFVYVGLTEWESLWKHESIECFMLYTHVCVCVYDGGGWHVVVLHWTNEHIYLCSVWKKTTSVDRLNWIYGWMKALEKYKTAGKIATPTQRARHTMWATPSTQRKKNRPKQFSVHGYVDSCVLGCVVRLLWGYACVCEWMSVYGWKFMLWHDRLFEKENEYDIYYNVCIMCMSWGHTIVLCRTFEYDVRYHSNEIW